MIKTYFALRVVCIANCGFLGTCDITNEYMNNSTSKDDCVERGKFLVSYHDMRGDGKTWRIECTPFTTNAKFEVAP